MTAPLTDDEQRRVTTCPDCGHAWRSHHHDDGCYWFECSCPRADETLTQVAALRDEWVAAVLEQAEDAMYCVPDPYLRDAGYRDGWTDGIDVAARVVRGLIPERAR